MKKTQKNFTHLHLHTEYSLLDGVSKIPQLIEKVKNSGMTACAITDHGVLYGAFEFHQACKENGIKPIIGCEVYVAERSRFDKQAGIDNKRYHTTLLAQNRTGYQNLVKIVSLAQKEGFYYKPRVDKELLEKYSEGIIALTGCLGSPLNQALLNNNEEKAEEWMNFLIDTFEHVFVEVMRYNDPINDQIIPKQLKIAKKYNLKVIATCDSHYIDQKDYKIQEIAWCISDGTKLEDPNRRQYVSQEFYVKTPQEMYELFSDMPEVVENTMLVADLVEEYDINFERIQPKFPDTPKGITTQEFLRQKAFEGAKERYGKLTKKIKERINYELEIIHNKGYDDYFLVVQDYCNWARSQGILVGPGRGSGAGSVVAYSLKITNIDPFKYHLIFERFLNPERPSPPDFDIDFQDDRRDELFEYMSQKYGQDNTAFIGTFGRLKTKAAIRDVARVMGIDLQTADKLSKMVIVKFGRVHSIDRMIEEVPEFKEIINSDPKLQELAEYVRGIENIARHTSTHACGYLVTPKPITNYVPLQKEAKGGGRMMTQYEGGPLEYLGLMKFDFLGLSNLTIINNTLKQIKYTLNKNIDIDKIDLNDKKTFKLFQKGETTGVFQFESEGMKKYLRELKPTSIEDLIFLNAAYRPGPMKYIPDYIERKFGRQKTTYLHPDLEPILKSTYGFAIYQEQVIKISVEIGGYTLGEADMLRRAMGKKKPEVMKKEKEKFIKKAQKNGYSKEIAQKIFSYMEPFADYGFNKSHSACYSLIAYQTAYLKANYPIQFMAGLMETNLGNADKIKRDIKEAKEMGIKILPPDINESFVDFKIESNKKYKDKAPRIRFGLGAIKGVNKKIIEDIIKEREEPTQDSILEKTKEEFKTKKFESLDDLIRRVGTKKLTKKTLELLIKAGAMDNWGNRNQLLEIMPTIFSKISKEELNMLGGQVSLFGSLEKKESKKLHQKTPLPDIKPETDKERLLWEKELLGTFISKHPLEKHLKLLTNPKIKTIYDIKNLKPQSKSLLLGIISTKKIIYSKKDSKPMAFLQLEDLEDKIEAVIFNRTYENTKDLIIENEVYCFDVMVNDRNGERSVIINNLIKPNDLPKYDTITIDISNITDKEELILIKNMIKKHLADKIKLIIYYGDIYNKKSIERRVDDNSEILQFLKKYVK